MSGRAHWGTRGEDLVGAREFFEGIVEHRARVAGDVLASGLDRENQAPLGAEKPAVLPGDTGLSTRRDVLDDGVDRFDDVGVPLGLACVREQREQVGSRASDLEQVTHRPRRELDGVGRPGEIGDVARRRSGRCPQVQHPLAAVQAGLDAALEQRGELRAVGLPRTPALAGRFVPDRLATGREAGIATEGPPLDALGQAHAESRARMRSIRSSSSAASSGRRSPL